MTFINDSLKFKVLCKGLRSLFNVLLRQSPRCSIFSVLENVHGQQSIKVISLTLVYTKKKKHRLTSFNDYWHIVLPQGMKKAM